MDKKKVAFPLFSHYNIFIKYFVEKALDAEYIMQPQMTRRTIDIGSRYSPDYVCTPFKITLGSMIEALEAGADTIIMSPGPCRLGYYGELQEMILKELGYEFDFVNFSEYYTGYIKDMIKAMRRINPKASVPKITKTLAESAKIIMRLDEIEADYYKNCGFEINHGEYKKNWTKFLLAVETAENMRDVETAYKNAKKKFAAISISKPKNPIKVGIVGEYYTAVDSFANLDLAQKIADMGVEVHRWMNVTNRNLRYRGKNLRVDIKDYCKYEMGPTSTANIWSARYYASHGFDGIIHAKSAGCTPEIDIMPTLQNISADYKIPILYLTYDSQTSDTGLDTRLEAFYDMISAPSMHAKIHTRKISSK
ncbi:MAG: hypothetical protein HFE90_09145 [Firmicutes bacterium]|nr:hypothetical protein [Bacillota bacterium]